MYEYPIIAYQEADHYWSSCRDIPEAHSTGDSLDELLKNAVDGITLALTIYVDQGREIPAASEPGEDQPVVALPAQTVAKIVLWNTMRAQGVKVADLARKLGVSHPVANRLVDFEHNSKMEQLENAIGLLNAKITLRQSKLSQAFELTYYANTTLGRVLIVPRGTDLRLLPEQKEWLEESGRTNAKVKAEDIEVFGNEKYALWNAEETLNGIRTRGYFSFWLQTGPKRTPPSKNA